GAARRDSRRWPAPADPEPSRRRVGVRAALRPDRRPAQAPDLNGASSAPCILNSGMQSLPIGKLRADTLQAIFDKHQFKDPRVVVGPRVGEDAAVIDMGDRFLVATSDPITFATAEVGWYALHVNANDIAVRGARPRWFLATLLLPASA